MRALLLAAGRLALAVLLVGFLAGGSCFVAFSSSDCKCDDCFDCDCNRCDDCPCDGNLASSPADLDPFRIVAFELLVAEGPAQGRRFVHVQGPTLAGALGPGAHGTDDLVAFTGSVLAANRGLLGLADGAGRLVVRDVALLDEGALVAWAQVPRGATRPLPGAGLTFFVDASGALSEIDDTIRR